MSACRSCKADIEWLVTREGKRMPVDRSSLTDEDVDDIADDKEVRFRHREHVSHFATCPQAKAHRR